MEEVAGRLGQTVQAEVLPQLETVQREEDLIAIWTTGRGPGLTDYQRRRFLGRLLHKAGRRAELAEVVVELEGLGEDRFARRTLGELWGLDG